MIDEFNQIYRDLEIKTKRQEDILKGLRNLSHKSGISFILMGTPDVLKLLAKDVETNNRYRKVEFPRFKLTKKEWKTLQKVMFTFDKSISNHFGIECNTAGSKTKIELIYRGSSGKIGSLVKIYERFTEFAKEKNSKSITINLIKRAIKNLRQDGEINDKDTPKVHIDRDWFPTSVKKNGEQV